MEKKEILEIIANHKDKEGFNNFTGVFHFMFVREQKKIQGFAHVWEFVNIQLEGWNKIEGEIPPQFNNPKSLFNQLKARIDNFFNGNKDTEKVNFQTLINEIQNTVGWFQYDCPEVDFLLDIYRNKRNAFRHAYNFLTQESINVSEKEAFIGSLYAYEFLHKDNNLISISRKSEGKSYAKLRNQFDDYLKRTEPVVSDYINKTSEKYEEHTKEINKLIESNKKLYEEWHKEKIKKYEELERIYNEKLKFEAPANYWKERAKKLKKQGWIAIGLILLLVGISSWSLGKILWTTPEQIYISWFGNDKSAAIRWSIIYVTLISFIAYGIRALTKFMFSSFHLAQDSEERYTLTFFYLALNKDTTVDDSERRLIIQSLFSRAETGLLKDDSTPTMPNEAIGKLLTK